jgi:hypothetical protein
MRQEKCCGDCGGEVITARAARRPLGLAELRERFMVLTHLMYSTKVPLGTLEREVIPFLAEDIEFVDPLVHARGRRLFRVGLRGFHCTFPFDFDIAQACVELHERGDRGRAVVDGVMNLRSIPFYTYPLRTTLVYDFTLTDGNRSFQITKVDEIWSAGDLLANLPVVGSVYDAARRAFGYVLAGMFWVSCAVVTRVSPSRRW